MKNAKLTDGQIQRYRDRDRERDRERDRDRERQRETETETETERERQGSKNVIDLLCFQTNCNKLPLVDLNINI